MGHLQLFFIHSAMNDHIIIYYMYITFTFRNNCLQSGNSHWVFGYDFRYCCIWGTERAFEIKKLK